MSVTSVIEQMPQEWQLHMYKLAAAMDEQTRTELAVRRQDIDALYDAVTGLTKAQAQTEVRVARLESAVTALTEAQKRTEERVGRLELAVTELAEAQKRTEIRVEELAQAQKRTEEIVQRILVRQDEMAVSLDKMTTRQDEMTTILGHLRGDNLERNYREKISSYLGPVMRKVKVIALQDIVDSLEKHLSTEEIDELWPLDLLVRGQVSKLPERPELWLAIEVSHVIDRSDITRAQLRAALLRKAGYRVLPVVAGPEMTEGAATTVAGDKIFTLRNGSRLNWDDALAEVLS